MRPAVIFECVGVPNVIQSVIEGAPQSARVVVVGVCMEADRQIPMYACFKGLSLQYVLAWTTAEFTKALELIASGAVNVSPMVTGKVGIGEVATSPRWRPAWGDRSVRAPWRPGTKVKRRLFVLEQVAEESHGICSTCRNRGDRLLTLDRSLVLRARLSAAALFAMKHISQPLPAH
jgi:hypothetical protein